MKMVKMTKNGDVIWNLDLALVTGLLGIVTTIASLIVSIQVFSELYRNQESSQIGVLLGIDTREYPAFQNPGDPEDRRNVMIGVLAFSICYLFASTFLIYASVSRSRYLTVPWLLCETISLLFQIATQLYHSINIEGLNNMCEEPYFTLLNVMFIIITVYLMVVVVFAQDEWKESNLKKVALGRVQAKNMQEEEQHRIKMYHVI